MSSVAYPYRYACCLLLMASAQVFAVEPAPTLDQANAALRLALAAETAGAGRESASPLIGALQESITLSAVQGCQPVDPEQTTCIVKLESLMRDGYQALRFRLDGPHWRLVKQADIAAPQPGLAQAQELVREHLLGLAERQADAKRAAEYREFATGLVLDELASCDLDRDSGAVECDGAFHTSASGKGFKPMRFALLGSAWSLLPD
ncbi:hypothetical protein V1318_02190 [Lysobacter sp. CCNWLW3]|uniref:hypothetical protein n=1 Tax=unclassified Lysobacter TaxID=2635362 RepID=UPI002FD3A556